MKNVFLGLLSFAFLGLNAQNTVGLLSVKPNSVQDGYTLIYPHNQSNVYLIDNCGEIAHVWTDNQYVPGNSAEISQDGKLYRAIRENTSTQHFHFVGGAGEGFEIKDWNNNVLWRWFYSDSLVRAHHDFTVMPNGNILAIAWEKLDSLQAIAEGRDPNFMAHPELWPEQIVEIEPIGTDSAKIVWKWRSIDHVVQDYDSTKANFGVISQNPHKINLNYGSPKDDWLHSNAIDYNPGLDQIVISVPTFNEIWVIDHSTTTSQAASSTGGLAGKGGDLLYRWGNPEAYGRGDSTDQMLYYQHDIHWADLELDNSDPDFNKFVVFNNRVMNAYSHPGIFAPVFDTYDWEYPMNGNTWGPSNFDYEFVHPDTALTFSTGLSSAQKLPNGNMLMVAGRTGYIYEVAPNGTLVFEYRTPLTGGNPVAQGTQLQSNANLTFKAKKYTASYPAFAGKDLSGKGFIELNPDTSYCQNFLSAEILEQSHFNLYPNPGNGRLNLETEANTFSLEIWNTNGQVIRRTENQRQIDISDLPNGMYILRYQDAQTIESRTYIKSNL